MATYIWCLGIATIYPPGALTIQSRPYVSSNDIEALVMNHAPPTEFDPGTYLREEPFQTLAFLTWSGPEDVSDDADFLHFDYQYVQFLPVNTFRLTNEGARDLP
jgi:hypothetical protein